jgi:hypothetical protein
MRNLKEHGYIIFGQKKLRVRIEIGDKVLESNIIDNVAPNVNFTLTHRKHTIVYILDLVHLKIRTVKILL